MTNPYTPGEVPRLLAGRREELDRIRDLFARVVTYAEMGGPLLVFHAPRGIGKTSLLRAAQDEAEPLGFVTVWVSCSRGTPVLPELTAALSQALDAADITPGGQAGKRWRARLDKFGVELGGFGVKVSADLVGDPVPDTGVAAAPLAALEGMLHDAATLVRSRGGAGLAVFIDELHAATRVELALLLNALQNLAGRRADNPLAVIAAGLPVTPEAITRAATFGERSTFVPLDVLSTTDARELLTAPAASLGVGWTSRALDAVIDQARGYPYFLQLLGSATWDAARPERGAKIGLPDARRGLTRAQAQVRSMYAARWGSATPGEQAFLGAMARQGDGNVTRAAIAADLGVDSRSLSVARERLIEKAIIEPVGHGLVRFTLPGFAAWLRQQGS
ncbi:MAG: ATP-binding protein [Nocardioides sp.]